MRIYVFWSFCKGIATFFSQVTQLTNYNLLLKHNIISQSLHLLPEFALVCWVHGRVHRAVKLPEQLDHYKLYLIHTYVYIIMIYYFEFPCLFVYICMYTALLNEIQI